MRHLFIKAPLLALVACGGPSSDKAVLDDSQVRAAIEETARQQSQGLSNASVKIHRAYNYESGHTWIKPAAGMKVVAVDVEFQEAGEDFDLEDVDVIDAGTNQNHGSDPDIFVLHPDGSYQGIDWPTALAAKSTRMLLLYEVPGSTRAVKLSYWGREIVEQPVELASAGPAMPVPEEFMRPTP